MYLIPQVYCIVYIVNVAYTVPVPRRGVNKVYSRFESSETDGVRLGLRDLPVELA